MVFIWFSALFFILDVFKTKSPFERYRAWFKMHWNKQCHSVPLNMYHKATLAIGSAINPTSTPLQCRWARIYDNGHKYISFVFPSHVYRNEIRPLLVDSAPEISKTSKQSHRNTSIKAKTEWFEPLHEIIAISARISFTWFIESIFWLLLRFPSRSIHLRCSRYTAFFRLTWFNITIYFFTIHFYTVARNRHYWMSK